MDAAVSPAPGAIDQLKLYLMRKGRPVWPLTIAQKHPLTPRMTRVVFEGATLGDLAWKRGQDLVLELPQFDGAIARRHYTIRDLTGRRLAIDFVRHGDSPAARWLSAAAPGDTINAAGPRGRTVLHDADWHLFIGDETALPAILAMLEGLPARAAATAFIEIAGDAERQPVPAETGVTWLSRDGAPAEPGRRLYDAIEAFALPRGRGHAYVLGETSAVRAIRQGLLVRGLAKERICAEGYWRPGRVGGHDHV